MARRRRVAYRKKRQNRFGMFLVTTVVIMIIVVVAINSVSLKEKQKTYDDTIAELNSQIEDEKARSEEIEEFRKYTQTKKYVEEVAKDKLGLVYENEIVFKADE